jgi:hypothetical protein
MHGSEVLPGFRLDVKFADGQRGIVDMPKDDFSGVFEPLADKAYFSQDTIEDGAVLCCAV